MWLLTNSLKQDSKVFIKCKEESMAKEPGNLSDLEGLGKDEWDKYISDQMEDAIKEALPELP
jgi:hypothetical protein